MKFTFAHNNFNVVDLEKSLKFYEEALNLQERGGRRQFYPGLSGRRGHRLPAGADLAQGLGEGEL